MTTPYIFDANVWGTVSDWVMVIVTTITAYFLYKTLQSQKEVQDTQNELFKIEKTRFMESIKPILKYTATTSTLHTDEGDKKMLNIEVINDASNMALDIPKVVSCDHRYTTQAFGPTSSNKRYLAKGDPPLFFHFLMDKYDIVIFSLNYQNIAGTKYKQTIFCRSDNFGTEIHPYLPQVVNEYDEIPKFTFK